MKSLLLSMAIFSSFVPSVPALEPVQVPAQDAKVWVLPNGLTVIVREDRSAPVASVQAWCNTGSIHEDSWMGSGLSHILEHMLFKGTETRDTNAITNEIQDQGGYVNAYTSFDRTVYWIDIPREGVQTALDVLCDAMMNSTLPEGEYVKEQEVIRREFAMGKDSPERVGQKLLFSTAYQWHPYREPVIGHLEIYNQLTRNDVMEYYKKRYVPNNLFFVVVGDVNADDVKSRIEKAFDKHPRRALEPVVWPAEPPQVGTRVMHREFPTEVTRLSMAWHIPSITHPDVPALDLLATVLGSGRSSRFYTEIRDRLGLAHSISAFSYTPGETGLFGVSAMCDPDKRVALEKEILGMVETLIKEGVTAEELEKARRQILSSQLESLTTMRGQASDLGSSWLLVRDLNFTGNFLNAIQKVTVEDLQRVARTYLQDTGLTVTSLNPPGTAEPTAAETESSAEYPIEKITLSNGLRVLVREDPRLPLVSASMVFRGGVLTETPEDNGITRLFSRMLLKGTTTRSAGEIADAIESVGGSIGSDSGNNSFSVAVDCLQPDLALAMELLSDVVLNPVYPEPALALEKSAQIAAIKAQQDQITAVAGDVLRQSLFAGHPYALNALGTADTVQSLTKSQLADYHQRQIHGGDAVLAVFGNVKKEEVQALAEKHFSKLAKQEKKTVDPLPAALTESTEVVRLMEKNQAVLMVGFRGLDLQNPDRFALQLVNEANSDMGSRFFNRIREEMGLAYFVGSSMTPGPVPGSFVFYVGTDPAKVEEVKKALSEEIKKLAREGLTEIELHRARKKLVGQMQIENQSNASFAYACALDELYGLGYAHFASIPGLVEKVTLEETKRVCAKYFLDQPTVTALVTPPVADNAEKPEKDAATE